MDHSAHPLCASDLQIEETGSEIIVFDSQNKKFHFLNATAHSILKACNGANSIRDIAVMLSRKFEVGDVDSLIDDVAETVSTFQGQGLLMLVADDLQLPQTASDSISEDSLLAVAVTGSSMFPALLSGDRVLVKKSPLEDLNVGDIILWSDDALNRVAHRIVSIDVSSTPPLITTKGDLTFDEDPPVEFERVMGKIVAVLRDGKVRWISELSEIYENGPSDKNSEQRSVPRPSYKKMQVLDLRDISVASVRNIGSVEQVSTILLSPENAHAWSEVQAQDVKAVVTAPREYRVYTGQPELLPDMLEFSEAPLRLIVSGQLFLTAFDPSQITKAFQELILVGQAYVSSAEAKTALEPLTNIVAGEISVVPTDHSRWIGQSILGPEFLSNSQSHPLVVIGDLDLSERLDDVPATLALFGSHKTSDKKRKAVGS
jgi:signal peptidase I